VPGQAAAVLEEAASLPGPLSSVPRVLASVAAQAAAVLEEAASVPGPSAVVLEEVASVPGPSAVVLEEVASVPGPSAAVLEEVASVPGPSASAPGPSASVPGQAASVAGDAAVRLAPRVQGGQAPLMARVSTVRSITLELPDEGFLSHPWHPEELAEELRLLWLIEQVRQRRLGHGKAAELSGLSLARFLEEMGKHGVSPFDYDPGELAEELGEIA